MRSFARLFSSSRRAPPKATSKPYLFEGLLQALGLPHVGVQRAVVERIDATFLRFRILVNQQLHARFRRHPVAQRVHVAKLPGRIDVQQRKWRRRGMEGLARQMQHHRRILADRVQHHRLFGLGDHFPEDVDALGFKALQMRQLHERSLREPRVRARAIAELPPPEGPAARGELQGGFPAQTQVQAPCSVRGNRGFTTQEL